MSVSELIQKRERERERNSPQTDIQTAKMNGKEKIVWKEEKV